MMFRKWMYGILASLGFVGLVIIDITMVIPFAANQIIALAAILISYLYLSYLIVFRKVF